VGAQLPPSSPAEVQQTDGFAWGDALIGALVAGAVTLLAIGAAAIVGQARRRTMESSA
jgi:hypothetical protein